MSSSSKRLIKAQDLYKIRPVSSCALSADGTQVVYSIQRVDPNSEKKFSNLWLASAETGAHQQFTYGNHVDVSPKWSPDGQKIAFLSNRGNQEEPAQLYLIRANGGEARPICQIKGHIQQFEWSPNGKRIVCSVQLTDKDVLERKANPKKKKLGIVARHITRMHHKFDGRGFLPKERVHIWTVSVKSGKTKQLTKGAICDEQAPTWSPDGKQILFTSNRADDPDFNPGGADFYVMSAKGGDFERLPAPFGDKLGATYSPDGQWIAYISHSMQANWWKHNHLWIVPTAGGEARCLTGEHDFHVGNASGNDLGGCIPVRPIWSTDSQRIHFQKSEHGNTTVHAINIDGSDLQTVLGETGVIGAYDVAADTIAYWHTTMTTIGEIKAQTLVNGVAAGPVRALSSANKKRIARKTLGEIETVWFKGAAGNDLQGWILKPPHFDPSKQYPSIMEMHGGPLVQYSNAFMHEFQYLAANGYVVYFCNPRGGRGYGEAHAASIWNDHGGADYDDVMAWADYVAELPYIDRERRGVTGGSYGGFLVNLIIGRNHDFKAAVTQRSIS
ncbi:MAG: prolyl oligopeptidase family serine peptidase, partial [Candidatus Promineifilaceae bacterium]